MIDAERVHALVLDCLFLDEELNSDHTAPNDPEKAVMVHGALLRLGFHKDRVEQHRQEVSGMLAQLPEKFREGWSFLNACQLENGELWTGDHRTVDELLCLGLAIEQVVFVLPREAWGVLPGGVPYFQVRSC